MLIRLTNVPSKEDICDKLPITQSSCGVHAAFLRVSYEFLALVTIIKAAVVLRVGFNGRLATKEDIRTSAMSVALIRLALSSATITT